LDGMRRGEWVFGLRGNSMRQQDPQREIDRDAIK